MYGKKWQLWLPEFYRKNMVATFQVYGFNFNLHLLIYFSIFSEKILQLLLTSSLKIILMDV